MPADQQTGKRICTTGSDRPPHRRSRSRSRARAAAHRIFLLPRHRILVFFGMRTENEVKRITFSKHYASVIV